MPEIQKNTARLALCKNRLQSLRFPAQFRIFLLQLLQTGFKVINKYASRFGNLTLINNRRISCHRL